jgi:hypothetical protein
VSLRNHTHVLELEQEHWNPSDWIHPNDFNLFLLQSLSPSSGSSGNSDDDDVPPDECNGTAVVGDIIKNKYIRGFMWTVDLCILQIGQVNNAYNSKEKEVEMFHLCMTKTNLNCCTLD